MVSDLEIILRLVLASVLGALVGLEREVHGREAGIRTYLLVSLGSALIMIVSEYLAFKYQGPFPRDFLRADPARIAAQAITGIGFLGAGVIIRYRDSIRGLTTAACMWVVCAMGLAIGSGYYAFGAVTAGLALLSLIGLKGLERRLRKDWYKTIIIVSEDIQGQLDRIQEIIGRYPMRLTNLSFKKDLEKKEILFDLRLRLRAVEPDQHLFQEVFDLPGIRSMELR